MLSLSVCPLSVLGFAYAQAVDTSNPIAVLLAMVSDFQSHAYLLAVAIGVAFVVSLAKQGWLSFWLQSKLPSWALPILAFVVAVGTTWATEVQGGIVWSKALWDAINAAALAVFAHQMVVEHMRGGKEIIPARKPNSPAPPANTGSGGPKSSPPKAPTSSRMRLARTQLLAPFAALFIACAANSPIWQTIENTILGDLENGSALAKIEQAVAELDPALAGDVQAIDGVIQAVITALEGLGAIPVESKPLADERLAEVTAKIARMKQSGAWHVLPRHAAQLVAYYDHLGETGGVR